MGQSATRSRLALAAARAMDAPIALLAILEGVSVELASSGTAVPPMGVGPEDVRAVDGVILAPSLEADLRFDTRCWARLAPGASALALAPVDHADRGRLGVLAVFDTQVRPWTRADRKALAAIACLVGEAVAVRAVGAEVGPPIQMLAALRDSEERHRLLFEKSGEAIHIAAAEDGRVGRILDLNAAAVALHGYTREELLCMSPRDFLAPGASLLPIEKRMAALEGTWVRVSNLHARKDGTVFPVEVTVGAIELGKDRCFLTIMRDVTERVRVEKALRDAYDGADAANRAKSVLIAEQQQLTRELRRKNEELEKKRDQAEGANRLKSAFLANMSHELRTPLNSILGFAEVLEAEHLGAVSREQKECLHAILDSARHLHRLVNDVLDLSKIEEGQMEFAAEPVDLAALVAEVCESLQTLAAGKQIRLETEVDPSLAGVIIDPVRLKQVLYSYVSNGIKFTFDGGRVTIRMLREGGERMRLEVEDTGIGIPATDLGRLFVDFEQLDNSTVKRYPGTGVGLALARRIVEALGGRVDVWSEPGQGSTFTAILPRHSDEGRALLGHRAGAG